VAALAGLVWLAFALTPVRADYIQTNLVSNINNPPGGAPAIVDTNLVNPWGVSFSAASPFWVSNQGTNTSTLYAVNSAGMVSLGGGGLVVSIPTTGSGPQGPTGQVQNNSGVATAFLVNGAPASFIFANLNGTISAWNNSAGTTAQIKATTVGAVYTGLAIGSNAQGPFLYAANTAGGGSIDVFNGSFTLTNLGPNAFKNPQLPAGLVPFNIQNIGGQLYVEYAPALRADQIAAKEGTGAVAIFDTSGNFIKQLISGSKLASPWGVALAPASFGQFGGDLLVGNFSYAAAEINAFDPVTGAYLGTLKDTSGTPLLNQAQGLWALAFGIGGNNGNPNTLYFATGLNGEKAGLFGAITPAQAGEVPEPSTAALFLLAGLSLIAARSCRRRR
jgi:uncharacterized protein (TIGR03118 family)